ncbi:DUF6343 family protein [Mumia sp. DW29H23]|uniref:DUF6343 family protein n=1 Tax=Mumia sp. DW29H23 TaxID=3421241 RepID=UPI003D68B14E
MSSSHPHFPRLRHTGSEPKSALSAYGLRLALALFGLIGAAAIALWVLLTPGTTFVADVVGVACVFIAVFAALDLVTIVRRMRNGQPHKGPEPRHRG